MLICSITGLPCQTPVVCTACGAVYEEAAARKRIEDGGQCIYGHEMSVGTVVPVKNGSVHSEESIEKVRIQSLSGMLDYFGSLVSSLAHDNYGLRKELAMRDAEGGACAATAPLQGEAIPVGTSVLQSIRENTAQLVAVRKSFLLPPDICLEAPAAEALGLGLQAHLSVLKAPLLVALSVSGGLLPTRAWPIYHPPHLNSSRLAIDRVAIACRLVLHLGAADHVSENTLLLLVGSRYVHETQVSALHLQELLPHLDLEAPPMALTSPTEVHHVHPYGTCFYTQGQSPDALAVLPLDQKCMGSLCQLQITLSSSGLLSSLASPVPASSPPLTVTYRGAFMGMHPDGRILATYASEDALLLLYDVCQLAYGFAPLLQHRLNGPPPVKVKWDASGQLMTLVHSDGALSQLLLSKGSLIPSCN